MIRLFHFECIQVTIKMYTKHAKTYNIKKTPSEIQELLYCIAITLLR